MKYDTGILAVIVLYKAKLSESSTFLSLSASLANAGIRLDLLVYDNSPDFCNEESFEQYQNWNIIYQPDNKNGGVSKAYNTGALLAQQINKKWLLLLDQDTIFPIETISRYLSSIEIYPGEKLFAPIMLTHLETIISPCYFKFMRGFSVEHIDAGVNSLNKFSVINCGICVEVHAFIQNMGYNENIQLDFSDHDFIKRFSKNIGNGFVVVDLKVDHELSSATKNSFENDLVRFTFYLNGAKHIEASLTEKVMLKINAVLRSLKLSLVHRNFVFIEKVLRWI